MARVGFMETIHVPLFYEQCPPATPAYHGVRDAIRNCSDVPKDRDAAGDHFRRTLFIEQWHDAQQDDCT